jgi:hypothetical protein
MRSDLEPRLRGLYRAPMDGQAEHERAHEDALVAALARRPGGATAAGMPERERGWSTWLRLPRFALAGVLGAAVAVGACVMPAEYPVALGYGFEITLPAERWAELDPEVIALHLDDQPGVERIEIRVHRTQEEHADARGVTVDDDMRMQLFVFGDAVDSDAILTDLRESFPELADAELRDVPLSGTVRGTFGGKLSHDLLDVVIDQHGVEEAERRVLAALAAEGIAPENARVDITEERGADGARRIEVRIEAERSEHAP